MIHALLKEELEAGDAAGLVCTLSWSATNKNDGLMVWPIDEYHRLVVEGE